MEENYLFTLPIELKRLLLNYIEHLSDLLNVDSVLSFKNEDYKIYIS